MQHLLEVVRSGASVADVTFLVNYLNHQVTDCKRVTQMLKTHVLLHRLLLDSGEEFRLKPANVRAEGTGGASGARKAKKGKAKRGAG